MRTSITKLAHFLNEGGNDGKVEAIEESIAELIEEAIEEELFFTLPTNEIVKIIQKSSISNIETYYKIIIRVCEAKDREAALILNAVEAKRATFEECVKIISCLKCSPVCVRLGSLFKENDVHRVREYKHELFRLKQKFQILKQQKSTIFKSVTEKPYDFESNIHMAANEGKITSIQYLFEQSVRANVEKKDIGGSTPLHVASSNGQIKVVKYLIEQCHANVEAKNHYGMTPLDVASLCEKTEVVKYLQSQLLKNALGCSKLANALKQFQT
jgi:hypothetical protein